jgi:ectoine hydroxylase-related dioxygenase (phytanoyl-CoA dioxygenase family)
LPVLKKVLHRPWPRHIIPQGIIMKFVQLTPGQRRSFEEDGFLVVKQALNQEMVARVLEAGDRIAHSFLNKPPVLDRTEYNHLDMRPGLLEEPAMMDLVTSSPAVPLIVQLLGPNIHLHSTSLTYKRPENPNGQTFRRGWHRDIRMPEDLGNRGLPLVGIKVSYSLTDFHRPASGLTLMARGTHVRQTPLVIPKGAADPEGIEVCDLKMDAGDALLFESRTFHTAAPNRSDRTSKVVIYGYAYRWMKQEIYLDPPDPRRLGRADLITRQLLGGYPDIDTKPWALQEWAKAHGVLRKREPFEIESLN